MVTRFMMKTNERALLLHRSSAQHLYSQVAWLSCLHGDVAVSHEAAVVHSR